MRVAHNISALSAFNSLNTTNNALQKTINALSTGLRINSASDDAAGFAVSEKMRSQISGLDTALRNTQDAASLLQTAEGALDQTNSMLQRMRELSIQASNDTLTSQDRQYIQLEVDQLMKQIDQIAHTTQFNKKRILDGSSGALWSSSDAAVKAVIKGSLVKIDNFGQKISAEGNYKIEINADPGKARVQKSNIFNIQEKVISYAEEIHEISINDGTDSSGAASGAGWNFRNGLLNITKDGDYFIVGKVDGSGTPIVTNNGISVARGVKANIFLRDINISTNRYGLNVTGAEVNLYLDPGQYNNDIVINAGNGGHCSAVEVPRGSKLTISSVDGDYATTGVLRVTGTMHGAGIGGSCSGIADAGDITILGGTIIAQGGSYAAGIGGGSYAGSRGGNCGNIAIYGGDVTAIGGLGGAGIGSGSNPHNTMNPCSGTITIGGGTVSATGGLGNDTITPSTDANYPKGNVGQGAGIGGGGSFSIQNTTITIDPSASVNASGYVSIGSGEYADGNTTVQNTAVTLPAAREVPDYPTWQRSSDVEPHQLSDIKQFYNSEGVFLVQQPQTIKITQGDGKTAEVTLYKTDSIYDVAEKINNAVSETLGQGKYTDNLNKFCTIADGTENTSESVFSSEPIYDDYGNIIGRNLHTTMLVRSAVPGKSGELYFSGDDEILRALGLNTIQEASETKYTASVYDAHSGRVVASGIKSSGNIIHDAIQGVDIEFSPMAGVKASWDEATKRYVIAQGQTYTAALHLKDNSTTFQTGANEGEDITIQLGDMSCSALGLSGVNMASRETASSSIGIIDRAIHKVSLQRAKIGAYSNALDHTMESLTAQSTNLTAAESRIRDADMSQMMMEFVKLQILNQSGTSMLSQANQIPQSVLNLMQ
mgnify:CR=1 FL=1